MPDKVSISHQGAKYEIGRGKRFYGIWVAGAPESDPIDRWPETREGWEQAWGRFVAIEKPETIAPVQSPRAGHKLPRMTVPAALRPRGRGPAWIAAGAGLLGLGVLLGVIGLFPSYVGTHSLAAQTAQLVPHLLYLLTWAVSAVLVAGGLRARSGGARIGALLGVGLSAVTFGLFFADLGQVIAYGGLGAGLVLSLLGWLACAAGSVQISHVLEGIGLDRSFARGTVRFSLGRGLDQTAVEQAGELIPRVVAEMRAAATV